jgi:hypothetical protein
MKKYAMIALFVLGIVEVAFPYVAVLLSDSYYQDYRTQYLKLGFTTRKQQEFFESMYGFITWKIAIFSLFGILTIVIGIFILLSGRIDKRRRHDA